MLPGLIPKESEGGAAGLSEAEKALGVNPPKPEHEGGKHMKLMHEAMLAGKHEEAHGHMKRAMAVEHEPDGDEAAPE